MKTFNEHPRWFNKIAHGICGSIAGLSIAMLLIVLISGKTLADVSGFAFGGVTGASLLYLIALAISLIQKK